MRKQGIQDREKSEAGIPVIKPLLRLDICEWISSLFHYIVFCCSSYFTYVQFSHPTVLAPDYTKSKIRMCLTMPQVLLFQEDILTIIFKNNLVKVSYQLRYCVIILACSDGKAPSSVKSSILPGSPFLFVPVIKIPHPFYNCQLTGYHQSEEI